MPVALKQHYRWQWCCSRFICSVAWHPVSLAPAACQSWLARAAQSCLNAGLIALAVTGPAKCICREV
jgi:hypothetical protein